MTTEESKPFSPPFQMAAADEDVVLYRGTLRVASRDDAAASIEGDGEVVLRWRPVPRLAYSLKSDMPLFLKKPGGKPGEVLVHGKGVTIEATGASISGVGTFSSSMSVRDGVALPSVTNGMFQSMAATGVECQRVHFHVPNFVDFEGRSGTSQATLEGAGWRFVIEAVPQLTRVADSLRAHGGHAITHVGTVERVDGALFSSIRANEALEDLGCLLSFASGRWSMPFLRTGLAADGAPVWHDFLPRKMSRWLGVRSWWTEEIEALESLCPKFMALRAQERWRSDLLVLISWYVEASSGSASETNSTSTTVETGLVLTQSALELMSWSYLVEELGLFTADTFKGTAAWKLRKLLAACNVPLSIPSALAHLDAQASAMSRHDGPDVFTAIRNAVIHATNIDVVLSAEPQARYEAKMLGLWYLEMSLLRLFDFKGEYLSRFGALSEAAARVRTPW